MSSLLSPEEGSDSQLRMSHEPVASSASFRWVFRQKGGLDSASKGIDFTCNLRHYIAQPTSLYRITYVVISLNLR